MPGRVTKPPAENRIGEGVHEAAELESALRQSGMHFMDLAEAAPVGIFVDDAQGKAIYINAKCAEFIGVPAERALHFNWIPFVHPEDRDALVAAWKKAFEASEVFRMEYRWVHTDGKIVWTLGEVVPILGADNKAKLFIGTLTDISAHKEAELEREALRTQLSQTQKLESIGLLAGGVAHDYNNYLGTIIGFAELALAEIEPGNPIRHKLEEILKASFRSAEITSQLLNFAAIQTVEPTILDVNGVLKNMSPMLEHLVGDHITIDWRPSDSDSRIRIDAAQFDQVVINICVNARDAIEGKGTIRIGTQEAFLDESISANNPAIAPGRYVCLSISDNGCGMDEETLGRIFEPFFTTKVDKFGTGLGLASVYGIVNQNKGMIEVESEPAEGTTFHVHFPAITGTA